MSLKIFRHIVINEETFEEQVKPLITQIRPSWNLELLKYKVSINYDIFVYIQKNLVFLENSLKFLIFNIFH